MKRRRFLKGATAGLFALGMTPGLALQGDEATDGGVRGIGVCDWSIGKAADPSTLKKVEQAKLDAVQVSVGSQPGSIPLRKPSVRRRYQKLCKEYDLTISSVAAGGILNNHPLFSEPQSAVFVVDAIEAAEALGADNILLAFFGSADLRERDENGNVVDQKNGQFSSYKLKEPAVQKVVNVLKQVAPRAETANVDIGLENTLTARQNVDIIERVGSDRISVYYDMGNSTHYGYNVPEEIRYLGTDRICEVHIKDRQENRNLRKNGAVNFQQVSNALRDINYNGWLVLETGGSINNYSENGAYARDVFGVEK